MFSLTTANAGWLITGMVSIKVRMEKYRSNMSEEKKAAVKEMDQIRKQLARSKITHVQLKVDREAARVRMQKLRQKRHTCCSTLPQEHLPSTSYEGVSPN